jgi:hypothetical protein
MHCHYKYRARRKRDLANFTALEIKIEDSIAADAIMMWCSHNMSTRQLPASKQSRWEEIWKPD